MRLTAWLRRRREHKPTLLERALKAHADYERDLAILDGRDDPPQLAAWPPATRGAYARYPCGCVQFVQGEPRWLRCSPHAVIAEMETWRPMKTIYSCPDCDGDLQPDSDPATEWCPRCRRTVPYAVLHDDGDPDDQH